MTTNMPTGWLGFDSRHGRLLAGDTLQRDGLIKPGDTAIIESRPQRPWRGVRLYVHGPCADSFILHSARAGARESLIATDPIPCDAFATRLDQLASIDALFKRDEVFVLTIEKAASRQLGEELLMPLVVPGDRICLHVENVGSAPCRFVAGFLGEIDQTSLGHRL